MRDFLSKLDIKDLHGFGHATKQKVNDKFGASDLGSLYKRSKETLVALLGKVTGEILYNALRGIDDSKLESDKPRKSVSCDINVTCFYPLSTLNLPHAVRYTLRKQ